MPSSKPNRNVTNEVQLTVVDGVPLLGVAERNPAKADERVVEYRVYARNRSEQQWVSVTTPLEGLYVETEPSLETTNGALLLETRSGIFQFDPEADAGTRLGSIDRLANQSRRSARPVDRASDRKKRLKTTAGGMPRRVECDASCGACQY